MRPKRVRPDRVRKVRVHDRQYWVRVRENFNHWSYSFDEGVTWDNVPLFALRKSTKPPREVENEKTT